MGKKALKERAAKAKAKRSTSAPPSKESTPDPSTDVPTLDPLTSVAKPIKLEKTRVARSRAAQLTTITEIEEENPNMASSNSKNTGRPARKASEAVKRLVHNMIKHEYEPSGDDTTEVTDLMDGEREYKIFI
jgi:hypothetical protein